MKKFMSEFKKFISRGNVMDMAVGIIIGGAFTGIVNSLVNDIINPILGIFGGMNFNQLVVNIPALGGGEVTLAYGNFITAIINFLIYRVLHHQGNQCDSDQIRKEKGSCTADGKRMSVLQDKDCNCCNPLSELYLQSGIICIGQRRQNCLTERL